MCGVCVCECLGMCVCVHVCICVCGVYMCVVYMSVSDVCMCI